MKLINIDQKTLKEDLYSYLQSLSNWNEIQNNIPASTLDILLSLIASYGVYETYKYRAWRQENYIQDATLDLSVLRLAYMLGYRVNRYTAPKVKVVCNFDDTKTFYPGMIFGSVGNYDLLYFGPIKKFEKGDKVDLYVGKYNEKNIIASTESRLETFIKPEELESVENYAINVYKNGEKQPISHAIEDYVIFQSIVDLSDGFTDAHLYIADKDNYYGIPFESGDNISIKWIETDGYLDFSLNDVETNDLVYAIEISHYGTNGDDIEKIRFLAPVYFSALRRMVTKDDHEYVIKAHPYFKDVQIVKMEPVLFKASLQLYSDKIKNQTFEINIQVNDIVETYTIETDENDTYQTALHKIFLKLGESDKILVREKEYELDITQNKTYGNVGYFTIKVSDNLKLNIQKSFQRVPCCSLKCYYINSRTIDDNIILTDSEQDEVAEYIAKYKMLGTRIVLEPAIREKYLIDIKISTIQGFSDTDYIKTKVREILDSYALKLNKPFYYGEFLSRVAQISYTDEEGNVTSVIDYVLPNQDTFDLPVKEGVYYTFDLNLEFVEV